MRSGFVFVASVLLLSACGGEPESAEPAVVTLPNGETPTAEEAAFLEAVTPDLSDTRAQDPLAVLNEGKGLCKAYAQPADQVIQQNAVEVLMDVGWTQSDAWVTVRGAAEHLCPNKG